MQNQIANMMILTEMTSGTEAAGKDAPNIHHNENFLPGVKRWDGIPFHDFRRIWFAALMVALGTISQDSYSLLQTARNQDLGSPGNPGTPAQTVQSTNRNQRLYAAIMNYIEPICYLFRYVSTNFANNGRGLYNYLWVYGHLPYFADVRDKMQAEWEDATISRAGIPYDKNTTFKWAEYQGRIIHRKSACIMYYTY